MRPGKTKNPQETRGKTKCRECRFVKRVPEERRQSRRRSETPQTSTKKKKKDRGKKKFRRAGRYYADDGIGVIGETIKKRGRGNPRHTGGASKNLPSFPSSNPIIKPLGCRREGRKEERKKGRAEKNQKDSSTSRGKTQRAEEKQGRKKVSPFGWWCRPDSVIAHQRKNSKDKGKIIRNAVKSS